MKTETLPAMPRENIVESFAAFFTALYESGVSYRKVRQAAYCLAREFDRRFPLPESAPNVGMNKEAGLWIGAIDSAILRAEANRKP